MKCYLLLPFLVFALGGNSRNISQTSDSLIFTLVEQMPQFPGGEDSIKKIFMVKSKYPMPQFIDGRPYGPVKKIIARFVVDTAGRPGQAEILRGVNPELDAEAIRLIENLPAFAPGRQMGKAVRVYYMLPVFFQ